MWLWKTLRDRGRRVGLQRDEEAESVLATEIWEKGIFQFLFSHGLARRVSCLGKKRENYPLESIVGSFRPLHNLDEKIADLFLPLLNRGPRPSAHWTAVK